MNTESKEDEDSKKRPNAFGRNDRGTFSRQQLDYDGEEESIYDNDITFQVIEPLDSARKIKKKRLPNKSAPNRLSKDDHIQVDWMLKQYSDFKQAGGAQQQQKLRDIMMKVKNQRIDIHGIRSFENEFVLFNQIYNTKQRGRPLSQREKYHESKSQEFETKIKAIEEKDHKEVNALVRRFHEIHQQANIPINTTLERRTNLKDYLRRLCHLYMQEQMEWVHIMDRNSSDNLMLMKNNIQQRNFLKYSQRFQE